MRDFRAICAAAEPRDPRRDGNPGVGCRPSRDSTSQRAFGPQNALASACFVQILRHPKFDAKAWVSTQVVGPIQLRQLSDLPLKPSRRHQPSIGSKMGRFVKACGFTI